MNFPDARRCPRCTAHVPESAQWCGQCVLDLRPPPAADAPQPPAPAGVRPEDAPDAAAMLAQLRAESPRPLAGFGRLGSVLATRHGQVMVIVGSTLLLTIVLIATSLALGSVLPANG